MKKMIQSLLCAFALISLVQENVQAMPRKKTNKITQETASPIDQEQTKEAESVTNYTPRAAGGPGEISIYETSLNNAFSPFEDDTKTPTEENFITRPRTKSRLLEIIHQAQITKKEERTQISPENLELLAKTKQLKLAAQKQHTQTVQEQKTQQAARQRKKANQKERLQEQLKAKKLELEREENRKISAQYSQKQRAANLKRINAELAALEDQQAEMKALDDAADAAQAFTAAAAKEQTLSASSAKPIAHRLINFKEAKTNLLNNLDNTELTLARLQTLKDMNPMVKDGNMSLFDYLFNLAELNIVHPELFQQIVHSLHADPAKKPLLNKSCERSYNPLNRKFLEKSYNPLIRACTCNALEYIKILVEAGANIHATAYTEAQYNLIGICSYTGNLEILKYLHEKNVPTVYKTRTKQQTPLHIATQQGHLHILQYLIEHTDLNVHINDPDIHNKTTLHYAVERPDNISIFRYLTEKGAYLDNYLHDPHYLLGSAISADPINAMSLNVSTNVSTTDADTINANKCEIVKYLLQQEKVKAVINEVEVVSGFTPLSLAIELGTPELVQILCNAGADAKQSIQPKQYSKTSKVNDSHEITSPKLPLLYLAVVSADTTTDTETATAIAIEKVKILLNAGAHPLENLFRDQPNAIMAACTINNIRLVKILLQSTWPYFKNNHINFSKCVQHILDTINGYSAEMQLPEIQAYLNSLLQNLENNTDLSFE